MQLPKVMEIRGMRVLTSKLIAELYNTADWQIKQNYKNNKKFYVEGKHYVLLTGEELKKFKSEVEKIYPVGKTANKLYLWTEKGALLHAKSLNTDKAWEAYEYLIDFYFRVKEAVPEKKPEPKSTYGMVVDVPENPKIQAALAEARKYMAAMDVMLTEYNKYRSRDSYSHYFMMLNELSVKFSGKIIDLLANEPNLINKSEKKFDINEVVQELATKPHLLEFMKLASTWSREQQGKAVKLMQTMI